jgi:hypothetical protein
MLFIVITAASLLWVIAGRTRLRYAEACTAGKNGPGTAAPRLTYGRWLSARLKALAGREAWKKIWAAFAAWTAARYPGWTKWIFAAFGASLAYLAVTGIFYAVFIPRGMFGFPLLGHMAFGGLFAASLAALLLWRARAYAPGRGGAGAFAGSAGPVFKKMSKDAFRAALFWAMAVFGFVLITTALGSMLPLFTFDAQRAFIDIHRYAALGIVLCAIVFADLAFIPPPKA